MKYGMAVRRRWLCILCAVLLCVSSVQVPGIAEGVQETFCGIPYHEHTQKCYKQRTGLACTYESLEVHVHEESCYDADGYLVCGKADYLIHTHVEECYNKVGDLVCRIPARKPHEHKEYCYEIRGAHTHGPECYITEQGSLVCGWIEGEGHAHTDACYGSGELICALEENHTHGDSCYSESRLVCSLSEHAHTNACYGPGENCLCGMEAGHFHGDSCYSAASLICTQEHEHGAGCYSERQLICTKIEGHEHSAGCFETVLKCGMAEHSHASSCYSERQLVCTKPEGHVHAEGCYAKSLICQMEERPAHTHEASCYEEVQRLICEIPESAGEKVLVCGQVRAPEHIHSEKCYQVLDAKKLTCGIEGEGDHFHTKMCYGYWDLVCKKYVHVHELICYSDPTADLEPEWRWEYSMRDVVFTGVWAEDVLAIAESQLGYKESSRNYQVAEDGETTKGYTRYGEWYGAPYADWCAMFLSFCLKFAGVQDMPRDATCRTWVEELSAPEFDLYRKIGEYAPKPSDLMFFDLDEDGKSDHVAMVVEVQEDDYKVIEGNVDNMVKYSLYAKDDPTIIGFGLLPVQEGLETEEPNPYICGREEHIHSEECYDEAGMLICTLSEHAHTKACEPVPEEEIAMLPKESEAEAEEKADEKPDEKPDGKRELRQLKNLMELAK